MGESSAKQQDEARARELYRALTVTKFGNENFHDEATDVAALTAAFAEVRRGAIETAAKVCEAVSEKRNSAVDYEDAPLDFRFMAEGADECAERIRSLAPEPPGQPGAEESHD